VPNCCEHRSVCHYVHYFSQYQLKLLKDKCYKGSNEYGPYYLYSVSNGDGTELSFFAPQEIHEQIVAHGLKAGSEFTLRRKPVQNGKKITGELVFELIQKPPAPEPSNGNDVYREIMRQCLQDAIMLAISINGVPLQAEDIRAISSCLFIARTRVN
jgi:hypothetical protein